MTDSRFDYTQFTDDAKKLDAEITTDARALEATIEILPGSREKSLAMTKLEESIMWARKALREVL